MKKNLSLFLIFLLLVKLAEVNSSFLLSHNQFSNINNFSVKKSDLNKKLVQSDKDSEPSHKKGNEQFPNKIVKEVVIVNDKKEVLNGEKDQEKNNENKSIIQLTPEQVEKELLFRLGNKDSVEKIGNLNKGKDNLAKRRNFILDGVSESYNTKFALGKYEIGKKLWYYQKRFFLNQYTTSTFRVEYPFILPLQMKEIVVSIISPIRFNSLYQRYGYFPGYKAKLIVNNTVIATEQFEWISYNSSWFITKAIRMEGSLFNVTAGSQKVILEVTSLIGYSMYNYDESQISNSNQATVVTMIGYPSLS